MPAAALAAFQVIGAVVGAVGAGVAIAGQALAGAPLIGGALAAGGTFVGAALSTSAAAISAGGIAGAIALGRLALNVSLVAGLIGGTPQVTHPGSTLSFKADPDPGIPYMMGVCATGGYLAAPLSSNDTQHKWFHQIVVLSGCGPIEEVTSFKLGETTVSFTSGAATTSPYTGSLWMTSTLGPVSSWSLTQPSGTGSTPEWTSSHKLTGYAASRLILMAGTAFPQGGFPPPLWKLKGVKVYDPRLDSTYPGGSGSCRALDETTYVYSANPYLHALTYALGRFQNSIRIMGPGVPAGFIDIAAYVAGANTCDTNSWTLGGAVNSKDAPAEALKAMLQAGGGIPCEIGGRLSCLVSAPKTPVAVITEADVVGPVTFPSRQPRANRFNAGSASYVSEAHGWQTVPAALYKVDAYISDEGRRSRPVTYPLVTGATQATQLIAYGIYDSHEPAPIQIPVAPYLQGIRAGDAITVYLPTVGLDQDLLVIQRKINPATLACVLVCRGENTGKHAAALGLTGTAPGVPTPTLPDPTSIPAPSSANWSIAATTESKSGLVYPVVRGYGDATDNPAAEKVICRWSKDGTTLIYLGSDQPKANMEFRVPQPVDGEDYYLHFSYVVRGVESATALTKGPVTAGSTTIPAITAVTASLAALATTVATKSTIYKATSAPAFPPAVNGDYWIDSTSGHNNATYFAAGGSWTSVVDPRIAQAVIDVATAQATADGKVQTFHQPTAPDEVGDNLGEGDIWWDSSDGDKPYRWNASTHSWDPVQDADIAAAQATANTANASAASAGAQANAAAAAATAVAALIGAFTVNGPTSGTYTFLASANFTIGGRSGGGSGGTPYHEGLKDEQAACGGAAGVMADLTVPVTAGDTIDYDLDADGTLYLVSSDLSLELELTPGESGGADAGGPIYSNPGAVSINTGGWSTIVGRGGGGTNLWDGGSIDADPDQTTPGANAAALGGGGAANGGVGGPAFLIIAPA